MDVFIINLSASKDRKQHMKNNISAFMSKLSEKEQQDFNFTFFEAIDKNTVKTLEIYNKYNSFLAKLWRGKDLQESEKACFGSHYQLWQKCVQLNKPIVILEDDVDFMPYFKKGVQDCFSSPYDFVKIAMSSFNNMTLICDNFAYSPKLLLGSTGYFLTPKGAKQFIKNSKYLFVPLDDFIGNPILSKTPVMVYLPKLIEVNELNNVSVIKQNQPSKERQISFFMTFLKEIFRIYRKISLYFFNLKTFKTITPHFTNQNLP